MLAEPGAFQKQGDVHFLGQIDEQLQGASLPAFLTVRFGVDVHEGPLPIE
ncbi:MAG: hypothetical protein PVSMB6_19110 [Steroidobacteraceae bacterium]